MIIIFQRLLCPYAVAQVVNSLFILVLYCAVYAQHQWLPADVSINEFFIFFADLIFYLLKCAGLWKKMNHKVGKTKAGQVL